MNRTSRKRRGSCIEDELFLKKALLQENRVLIYQSTLSLKEMACYAFIGDLWQRQNTIKLTTNPDRNDDSGGGKLKKYSTWHPFILKLRICIERLDIPETAIEYLRSRAEKTCGTLYSWWYRLNETVFMYTTKSDKYTDQLVWRYDGGIDYSKTAKNMVKFCDELTDLEKFRLISAFCLEDEMKDMMRSLSKHHDLGMGATFEEQPLMYYWRSYSKGGLNKIKGRFVCAESRMITSRVVNDEHVAKYFWGKLPVPERIAAAKHLIRNSGRRYQAFVLSELNEMEQRRIFTLVPHIVIDNFLKDCAAYFTNCNHSAIEYVFSTWMYIRDFITVDNFAEIVRIFIDNFRFDYKHHPTDELLGRIWDNCPNRLKKFALESPSIKLVEQIVGNSSNRVGSPRMDVFLSKVLSDADEDVRNNLLRSSEKRCFWTNSILSGVWSVFYELVVICGGNEEDANNIKNEVIGSSDMEKRSRHLLRYGTEKELNELLSIFFSDKRAIAAYKIGLLSTEWVVQAFFQRPYLGQTLWMKRIDDIIGDPDAAYKYKKKVAFSNAAWDIIIDLTPRSVDSIDQFCTCLLNPKDQKRMKNKVLRYFHGRPYDEIFDSFCNSSWNNYLRWALGSEENVAKYKRSLPVDEIFQSLLQHSIFKKYDRLLRRCEFRDECDFRILSEFVWAYYETKEEVEQFKLRTIYEYQKIPVINKLLEAKSERRLGQVLNWFFSRNDDEIQKFMQKFPSSDISAVASVCHLHRRNAYFWFRR